VGFPFAGCAAEGGELFVADASRGQIGLFARGKKLLAFIFGI
jgi:hypothetical protein